MPGTWVANGSSGKVSAMISLQKRLTTAANFVPDREHIYRRHAMPIHCSRCRAVFETDAGLSAHMRVSKSEICELNTHAPLDGFTPDQGKAMRCRKTSRGLSEEKKWIDLSTLLFPDCDPENFPEPCNVVLIPHGFVAH